MHSLFDDLGLDSARIPGLHSGQQDLFILLNRLAADQGQWTGSRAELAKELGCSSDTVTRRKDKLVAMGLISSTPAGRVMTYRVLSTKPVADAASVGRKRAERAQNRFWYRRPDDNQLELDFGPATPPTNRREVARRLAATTMEWMSLVITLVVGPKSPATQRPTTPATLDEKTPEPTTFEPSLVVQSATPTTEPEAPIPEPTTPPAANQPSIGIGTSIPESNLLSPISPIPGTLSTEGAKNGKSRALKFCLWQNAKKSDFQNAEKVQEAFERLLRVGGCTADERVIFFRFCNSVVEQAKSTDNVPGLITSILRGSGTPWRSRGHSLNEKWARDAIRRLDVPLDIQKRTSDLSFDDEKRRQIAAFQRKYEKQL